MSATRISATMALVTLAALALQSCYKVATVPRQETTSMTTETVSFAGSIQPILDTHCAMSSCHNTGGIAPDLSSGKGYSSLLNGGYVDTASPESSGIYLWLTGQKKTPMPPGGPNPSNINSLMLAWIQQGAPDN
jgi:hypothetical protein